ncbi:hypothetical protein ACIBQ1_40505 [Nonomuraea sp. NPDC050153]|uniref:hypothetical protein n=1 Tax=Nonomuraea sp. NPDC050153 TaxID=3364359 RepID=UPI0037B35E16
MRAIGSPNARHCELEAVSDDGRPLDLVRIGADQGLLATPVTHRLLPLAPVVSRAAPRCHGIDETRAGLPV